MSDEYRSQFISSLILSTDDLYVEEFENFTAIIEGSSLPLFKDMVTPWKLKFSIDENNKLAWSAIEYNEDDEDEVMSGKIEIKLQDTPRDTLNFDDVDPDAHEFIETMFPGNTRVEQVYAEENIFRVNDTQYYNFENMMKENIFSVNFENMMNDNKYIGFEFICA
jgi:hypothetical protein